MGLGIGGFCGVLDLRGQGFWVIEGLALDGKVRFRVQEGVQG